MIPAGCKRDYQHPLILNLLTQKLVIHHTHRNTTEAVETKPLKLGIFGKRLSYLAKIKKKLSNTFLYHNLCV